MPAESPRSELTQIYHEMGKMRESLTEIDRKVTSIVTVCGPCQERLHDLESAREVVQQDVAVLKAGRTDTLTIKSVGWLIGVIGGLIGTIIGGVAMLVGRSPPASP